MALKTGFNYLQPAARIAWPDAPGAEEQGGRTQRRTERHGGFFAVFTPGGPSGTRPAPPGPAAGASRGSGAQGTDPPGLPVATGTHGARRSLRCHSNGGGAEEAINNGRRGGEHRGEKKIKKER